MNNKLSPAMAAAIDVLRSYDAECIDTPWWTWWQVIGPYRYHISTRTMNALERRGLVEIYGKRGKCVKLKDKPKS